VGDSTSGLGWLYGASFDDRKQSVYQEMAREFTSEVVEAEVVMYGQYLPELSNVVADSLSRDHHLDDGVLTNLLRFVCPSQLPHHFSIRRLPPEITSFISSKLERLPRRQPEPKTLTRSIIGHGVSSRSFAKITESSSSILFPSAILS